MKKIYAIVKKDQITVGHGETLEVVSLATYEGYKNTLCPLFETQIEASEFKDKIASLRNYEVIELIIN